MVIYMARTEIAGMTELERTIRQLEQLPQKVVSKAARKGMTIPLKAARRSAPEEFGNLKRGIKLVGERSTVRGKKIYQVTFDKALNHVFVKTSKEGKRSYYPASQEYGFMTRDGGYVPGYHFLRNSMDDNVRQITETTVKVMTDEIDKIR